MFVLLNSEYLLVDDVKQPVGLWTWGIARNQCGVLSGATSRQIYRLIPWNNPRTIPISELGMLSVSSVLCYKTWIISSNRCSEFQGFRVGEYAGFRVGEFVGLR